MKMEDGNKLKRLQTSHVYLHLKGNILRNIPAHSIFKKLGKTNYCIGKQLKFMSLTKLKLTKEIVFLTLASEEARDLLLDCGLTYNREIIKVSVTRDNEANNTLETQGTTLIGDNLPQNESQTTIVRLSRGYL